MFENTYFFLFICLLFFGIGDVLGVATKAKLSSVFVSLFLFLIGFVTGIIPPDIIKVAGLSEMGKWATCFIVFSMGTTINLRELLAEWRTVATAVLSMLSLTVAGFALVPLIGYEETIVAIPILNGGIVATQMMTTAAMEQGFQIAAALGAILYAVQKFVGTPIASYFGLREANALIEEYRRTGVRPHFPGQAVQEGEKKPTFFERHKKYYGAFTSLALTATFAWISYLIQLGTGLSATIWALILGAVVSYLGIVPPNILKHANSSGIFNIAVFASIIPSLALIKVDDLITLSYATVVVFILSVAVLFIFFYVLPFWKLIGSRNLAMGVASCQLLGFPATYLIANEVAQAAAENDEEKQIILDRLMPKYLVGGFSTVTTFSVIIAGFFVPLL